MIGPSSGPHPPGRGKYRPNHQDFQAYPNSRGRGGSYIRGGRGTRGGKGNYPGHRQSFSEEMDTRYPPPPPRFSGGSRGFRGRPNHHSTPYDHSFQPRFRPDFQRKRNYGTEAEKSRSTFNDKSNTILKQNSDIPEQREYPCRCLFVRNIEKFNTSEHDIVDLFSGYGELKLVKEKISDNGVAYITFFDIRASETARSELNGQPFKGRLLDVHFSFPNPMSDRSLPPLPKDNQGSLKLFFRRCEVELSQEQLFDHFSQFGEIADIQTTNNPQVNILSYYDCRACLEALERSDLHIIQGGEVNLCLAWDKFAPIAKEDQYGTTRLHEFVPPPPPPPPAYPGPPVAGSKPGHSSYPHQKDENHYNDSSVYPNNNENYGVPPPPNNPPPLGSLGPLSTQELIEKAKQAQEVLNYIKTQTTIKLPETPNDYYNPESFQSDQALNSNNYYQHAQKTPVYDSQGYYVQNPPPAPPQSAAPYGYPTGQQSSVPPPPPQSYFPKPGQYPVGANNYDQHGYSQPTIPNVTSQASNTSSSNNPKSHPGVNQLLQLLAQANSKHGRN